MTESSSNNLQSGLIEENAASPKKSFKNVPFIIKVVKLLCDSFQGTGKRTPPAANELNGEAAVAKTEHVRLITIGVRHWFPLGSDWMAFLNAVLIGAVYVSQLS